MNLLLRLFSLLLLIASSSPLSEAGSSSQDDTATELTRQRAGQLRRALHAQRGASRSFAGTLDMAEGQLEDGWGEEFRYTISPQGLSFLLASAGPDRAFDTEDDLHFDDQGEEWRRGGAVELEAVRRFLESWPAAVEGYRSAHGKLPEYSWDLTDWLPDFTGSVVNEDPWDNGIVYDLDGDGTFLLSSRGPDGLRGTPDDWVLDALGAPLPWRDAWRRKLAHLVADLLPEVLKTGGSDAARERLDLPRKRIRELCDDDRAAMGPADPFEPDQRSQFELLLMEFRADALPQLREYLDLVLVERSLARLVSARDDVNGFCKLLGRYPEPDGGLETIRSFTARPDLANITRTDALDVPFVYEAADDMDFSLRFCGLDGQPNTADDFIVFPKGPPVRAGEARPAPGREPAKELTTAFIEVTRARMLDCASALEEFPVQPDYEDHPFLWSVGIPNERLQFGATSRDAWGRNIWRVKSASDATVFLRSFGPDQLRETDDDIVLNLSVGRFQSDIVREALAQPPADEGFTAAYELALVPRAGEFPDGLHISPGGHVAAIMKVEGGKVLAVGEHRSEVFDHLFDMVSGDHPLAVAALGRRNDEHFLVTVERSIPTEFPYEISFLEGTSTPVFRYPSRHGPAWSMAGEDMGPLHYDIHRYGPPAVDSRGVVRGFRASVEGGYVLHLGAKTSPVFAWASDPVVISYRGEETLFYRYVDGKQMHVVYGDEHLRATWADDPVISPDGQRIAFRATIGGTPGEDYVELCKKRHSGYRADGLAEGAQQLVVIDGKGGQAGHRVGGPLFSPDSRHVAYAYQEVKSGPVKVHVQGPEHFVATNACRSAWKLLFDESSTHLYYQAELETEESAERICIVELGTAREKRYRSLPVAQVLAGPTGQFLAQSSKEAPMALLHFIDTEECLFYGDYQDVQLFGFTATGLPVARVTEESGQKLFVGGFSPAAEWVTDPVLGTDGTVAAIAHVEGGYEAFVVAPDGSELSRSETFAALEDPVVLDDGSVWIRTQHDGESVSHREGRAPMSFDGWTGWISHHQGQWKSSEVFDEVERPVLAKDGRAIGWQLRRGDDWFVESHGPQGSQDSGPFMNLRGFEFLPDGRPVFGAEDEHRYFVVTGTQPGGSMPRPTVADVSPAGEMALLRFHDSSGMGACLIRPGQPRGMIRMSTRHFVHDKVLWTPDGEGAFTVGANEGGEFSGGGVFGQPTFVHNMHPPGSAGELHTFDAASLPVLSQDGSSVLFAAFEDGVIKRITFPFGS